MPRKCSFPGCDRPHCAKGLCNSHYDQKYVRGLEPRPIEDPPPRRYKCSFQGCDRKHEAKGLCGAHYAQMAAGKPLTPIRVRRPGKLTAARGRIGELEAEVAKLKEAGGKLVRALREMQGRLEEMEAREGMFLPSRDRELRELRDALRDMTAQRDFYLEALKRCERGDAE